MTNKTATEEQVDRRGSSRFPMPMTAKMWVGEENLPTRDIENVSLTGMFIQCSEPPAVGTICRARLEFGEEGLESSIEAKGMLVRSTESGFALRFTGIDLESQEHLRNFLAGNP